MLEKSTVDALNCLFFPESEETDDEAPERLNETHRTDNFSMKNLIIESEVQLPKLSLDEKHNEVELLCNNLNLILKESSIILEQPEYFYCYINSARLGLTTFGTWQIPLGVLILLWKDKSMIVDCPLCQGKVYVVSVSGSPLSGSNSCSGACINCCEIVSTSVDDFPRIWKPLLSMRDKYRNSQKVLRKRTKYFSWKEGVVGQETPDMVIKESVSGVSLQMLIQNISADK